MKKKPSINNSKNQINIQDQSAGNEGCINSRVGSSETICVLSKKDKEWLAGVIDGDGNFDIRNIEGKRILKAIRVTQHIRDIRILYHIKDLLKCGRIRKHGVHNVFNYIVSHKEGMMKLLLLLNGNIRLKVDKFKEACMLYNIEYIVANNQVQEGSAYLSGLVDTDGSIVFNYPNNRIELHIEVKQSEYSLGLDLSQVIKYAKLKVYKYKKRNQSANKTFYSIRYSFSSMDNMVLLYNFFKENRLYSNFKFFRVMCIKEFLELRYYKRSSEESYEYKTYIKFLYKFNQYMNEGKQLPKYLDNEIVRKKLK